VYSLLAILYFVLCYLLSAAVRMIERRLTASSRHATVTAGASLSAV
jgi:ABC-type arginine/histidine transport system permease subunit